MDALAESPPQYKTRDPAKPRRHRVNLALAGTLLAQGMTFEEVAPQVGAATANSLRVNLGRKGVTMASLRKPSLEHIANATVTARVVAEADNILRDRLNNGLSASIDALVSKKPSYKALASRGQGHAATLKQLAETWRTLNGNPDSITVQFGVGRMDPSQMIASQTPQSVVSGVPVTDVEATVSTPPMQVPDNG